MTSIRRILTASFILSLCALVLLTVSPVAAQDAQSSNLIVYVSESDAATQTQKNYLLRVAPDKAEPFDTAFDVSATQVYLSPDGQWFASLNYTENGAPILTYTRQGQPATTLNLPAGTAMVLPSFSPDSKYFVYSMGNFEQDVWELHIIDLSNNSQRVLTGKLSTMMGAPDIVGWNPDGKRVYMLPIYLEGPSRGGPTEIDLSTITFSGDQPQALPAGKPILEQKYQEMHFLSDFSNDASKLVFSFFDEARPVPNYMGMGTPMNTIAIHDVATGETKIVYEAMNGEAVLPPVWSADGTKVLFLGGSYTTGVVEGSSNFTTPKLYSLDVATGKVSEGASISVTPTDSAFLLKACGDTLFYMVNHNGADKFSSSLYSVSVADPTKQSEPLHTSPGYYMALECVAL